MKLTNTAKRAKVSRETMKYSPKDFIVKSSLPRSLLYVVNQHLKMKYSTNIIRFFKELEKNLFLIFSSLCKGMGKSRVKAPSYKTE